MLPTYIHDEERLYKSVKPDPENWKEDRISSANFKDSKGVSVDRDGGRIEKEIISDLTQRFQTKAVISVTAAECRQVHAYPVAKPLSVNPYHAEIHRSPDKISLTKSQARHLSKLATMVYNTF